MEDDKLRRARELGLERLAKHFPRDFEAALAGAERLRRSIPRDLKWTEEPAHVFTLPACKEGGRQ